MKMKKLKGITLTTHSSQDKVSCLLPFPLNSACKLTPLCMTKLVLAVSGMAIPREASIAEMKGIHCFSSGGDENKELQALMLLATCIHVAVSDDLHLLGHSVFMFSVSNCRLCVCLCC